MIKTTVTILLFTLLLTACSGKRDSIGVEGWERLDYVVEDLDNAMAMKSWKPVISVEELAEVDELEGERHLWLRARFIIEESASNYYGIVLERVDLSAAVYLNGRLLGETKLEEISNFDQSPAYPIPPELLKSGTNQLYIYLGSYRGWPIGLPGSVTIHPEDGYKAAVKQNSMVYEMLPIAILAMLFFTLLSLLLKFFYNRSEREHLYLALRLLLTLIYLLTLISPFKLLNLKMIFTLWYTMTPLLMLTLIYYYQSIYALYFSSRNRVVTAILTTFSLAGLINYLLIDRFDLGPILVLLSFIVTFAYSIYLLIKMDRLRPNRFKRLFITIELGTIIMVSISALLFLLFRVSGLNDPSRFMLAAALILSANSIIYYTRRDSIRKKRLDELFSRFAKEKSERELAQSRLTDSAEDKLKKLIKFIEENYAEPLTREELAAIVGLNANYLSTIFTTYTGKRLTAYINELRIKRAAELLKESNEKVINIAFTVGFESLATFNRLFKQQMEMTPTQFRQRR